MEAKGNLLTVSPGCRQGVILAPLAAGLLLPGSRTFGLDTFWNEREFGGRRVSRTCRSRHHEESQRRCREYGRTGAETLGGGKRTLY